MKKFDISILTILLVFNILSVARAVTPEKYNQWKDYPEEKFTDAEANFKMAMDKILQESTEKGLSKEDLYRAATAGMLEALNSGDHAWNLLLAPHELQELQSDLSGKVSGIGIGLSFDSATGYAKIVNVIPHSPSDKAGLHRDDQILSVNGKHYQGKQISDIASGIRGKTGESVSLKILRDDRVISVNVRREVVPWTRISLSKLEDATQLLSIDYFTKDTPKLVEEKLKDFNKSGSRNLIVDLRGNSGGGFEEAIQTAGLFVPKDQPVAITQDREGKLQSLTSQSGLLKKGARILVLVDKWTSSGAELLTGSLRDELGAKVVGETTFGKWNVQTIQTLTNGFAMKYSIMGFQTPKGASYQNTGLKPDVEVIMPKDLASKDLQTRYDLATRLELDPQLKAGAELIKAM